MRISVLIPAFNEAGNIGPLIEETYGVLPQSVLGEVIVVDDGSDDGTGAEVKSNLKNYSSLRYIRHRERSGKSAAIHTGVAAARFPVIATLDGDGQNDPRDILCLIGKLGPEASEPALVAGVRESRRTTGSRVAASRLANWIRDKLLDDGCPDTACGLKVYWREHYLALPFFTNMHRFMPALFLTYGHQIACEPVNDRPRLKGKSKYTNLGRALIGLYDLVGVSWLRQRTLIPQVVEVSGSVGPESGKSEDKLDLEGGTVGQEG